MYFMIPFFHLAERTACFSDKGFAVMYLEDEPFENFLAVKMIGISFRTSPIEIRERFYLQPQERALLLEQMKNEPAVVEALVLSTCNRVEIYAHLIHDDLTPLWNILCRVKGLSSDKAFQKYFYTHSGEQAMRHLFRVASGVDSLVLGEKQVLGQVKEAIDLSRQHGMLGAQFNILSQLAVRAGKKAQNETALCTGGTSMSWAAVTMAERLLGGLKEKSVLIIGAGKMGRLAVNYLKEKGVGTVYIMNRTRENSESLAQEAGGVAVPFWRIRDILAQVDVCICSTSCPHYLIEKGLLEDIASGRRPRPLALIDISMPRNIDPAAADVSGVSLMAIDDLERSREETLKKRQAAVDQVETIISAKVGEFYGKMAKRAAVETENLRAAPGYRVRPVMMS